MFELTVEDGFSAAHQLPEHPGPCARLHGHNYRVVIAVTGERLDDSGMLLDFGKLKEICGEVIGGLDHTCLNELPAFADTSPTSEALAQFIYRSVAEKLDAGPHEDVRVARVSVYESERSCATYSE